MTSPAAEVLIVSLGATEGLRRADAQLRDSIERAGVRASIAAAARPRPLRTMAATDLAWALSARAAARRALAAASRPPRAVVYSTTTAALLWPARGAVRFDATARGNRPGRHGVWQRPLERRRLAQATLLMPWSEGALREGAPPAAARGALVVPVAAAPSGPASEERDIAALTYAANPSKKGLDRVLAAWGAVEAERPAGEELLVAGTNPEECARAGIDVAGVPRVRTLGPLSTAEYFSLVRRARVFVCAPRREDYGIAQLEALADGCMLVTSPAPGPYAALPIARELDPRLVGEDLAQGLRDALGRPLTDYAQRAAAALAPYAPAAVDALVARELLPRLLS
ncbi:MAG TPA: glycosyltransferase [Solirubrobacteraceae bacterium]|jgi:hypothetical protein|nr:glycosyltransferase [Solirubrobacteraceae bacterium]